MKVAIRTGCFETNSSSTHALTTIPEAEWVRWRNSGGSLVLDIDSGKLMTSDEAKDAWGVERRSDGEWQATDKNDAKSLLIAQSINEQHKGPGAVISFDYPIIEEYQENKANGHCAISVEARQ